ncbi:MAG: hypothetical protein HY521_06905 [Proteobacteria bacterium]|nr:hypothetical protein [Pseudomonadota bacterium]
MSAESPILTRHFSVGERTVTLTMPRPKVGGLVCMAVEWSPTVPRRLSRRELRQYRAGRDAALAEVGRVLGGPVGVVEI